MEADHRVRHYLVFREGETVTRLGSSGDSLAQHAWQGHLTDHLQRLDLGETGSRIMLNVIAPPGPRWELVLAEKDSTLKPAPVTEHVCAIELQIPSDVGAPHEHIEAVRAKLHAALPDCLHMGADVAIYGTEYWAPTNASDWLFGDREQANRLIGTQFLRRQPDASGAGVNVIVVDQGVDRQRIRNFGGGWKHVDGPAPGSRKNGHGAMLVRNILDIAPEATIFDVPLITGAVANRRAFLSEAHAAYLQILRDVRALRRSKRWQGPWIFLNAWAIYDRQSELPHGDHTRNAQHAFNLVIEEAVRQCFDVVFCAGNCGQFCPMRLCGSHDIGPGKSILGANSHPKVLTIGAVRSDGMWLGYSSQGPGQAEVAGQQDRKEAIRKPDLCAPSQFAEIADVRMANTGTSAASAIAAGAVAALRSKCRDALSPAELKNILRKSARQTSGVGWNGKLGHGVLNLPAAYRRAEAKMRSRQGSNKPESSSACDSPRGRE